MPEEQGLLNQVFDVSLRALRVTATDDFWTGNGTLVSTNSDAIRINADGASTAQVEVGLVGPASQAGVQFGDDAEATMYRRASGVTTLPGIFEVGGQNAISLGEVLADDLYRVRVHRFGVSAQYIEMYAAGGEGVLRTAGEPMTFMPGGNECMRISTTGALTLPRTAGGFIQMVEQGSDPSAPAVDNVVLFAKDNGGGKTALYARFNTGVVQEIAVEP